MTLAGAKTRSPSSNYRVVALIVSTSLFMQYLDSTILITSLPAIARDFGVPAIDMNVALLSYQLALAIFIPAGSAAAHRFGARRTFMAALATFMIGSVLCGLCETLPTLVAARGLQGIGGAMMMPVGRLIVVRSSDKADLISAMNWLLVPGIIGPLIGPPVGGFITTYGSWHWIFFLNVPVALLGLLLSAALLPDVRDEHHASFDLVGMILLAPALASLVFGLESAGSGDHLGHAFSVLAIAGIFLTLYGLHAHRHPAPLIDLRLLKIETFRSSMAMGSLLRVIASADGFLLPLWFQLGFGMTPAQSGAITFMMPAGALLSRTACGAILRRMSVRAALAASCLATAIAILGCSMLQASWPHWTYYPFLLALGFTTSTPLVLVGALTYVDVPPNRAGPATGFYTTIQQITLSLGVTAAVSATGLARWITGASAAESPTYSTALYVFAGLALCGAVTALRLPATAGEALRGTRGAGPQPG